MVYYFVGPYLFNKTFFLAEVSVSTRPVSNATITTNNLVNTDIFNVTANVSCNIMFKTFTNTIFCITATIGVDHLGLVNCFFASFVIKIVKTPLINSFLTG